MAGAARALAFKRLLVATDLSTRAEKALARAVQVAAENGAGLTVLHVMENGPRYERGLQQAAANIERELRLIIEALGLRGDARLAVRIVGGKPFLEIIRHAREEAADLIIVGAHGADFIKDMFLGTTAEKVARKGDRSLLVVKRAARGPYRRVVVPVDFSAHSRHALELALRFASQAEFHVLHVCEGFEAQLRRGGVPQSEIARHRRQIAGEARRQMESFLRGIDRGGKPIKRQVWNGKAPHEIAAVAKRLRADLVAVGTTGRTGLPYILLGSVAEHVLREVSCDVLVARAGSPRFRLP